MIESVLTDGVLFTLGLTFKAFLIIELVICLGKPFQDEKFFNKSNRIYLALTTKKVIQDVFHFHRVKELILVYWPVCVFLWGIPKSFEQISMPRKWGTQCSKVTMINFKLLSKLLNFCRMKSMSFPFTTNKESSTYLA